MTCEWIFEPVRWGLNKISHFVCTIVLLTVHLLAPSIEAVTFFQNVSTSVSEEDFEIPKHQLIVDIFRCFLISSRSSTVSIKFTENWLKIFLKSWTFSWLLFQTRPVTVVGLVLPMQHGCNVILYGLDPNDTGLELHPTLLSKYLSNPNSI